MSAGTDITKELTGDTPSGPIDLSTVTSLREAFRRLPEGPAILRLADRLGVTSEEGTIAKVPFKTAVSNLSDGALSDYMQHITARAAAMTEIAGVLAALQSRLKMRAKSTRAKARGRALAAWKAENPDAKTAPKVADVAALVELDEAVLDIENQITLVDMFAGMVAGAKEGHLMVKESLSREITLRSARLQARF